MIPEMISYQRSFLLDVAGGYFAFWPLTVPILLVLLVIAGMVIGGILINKSDRKLKNQSGHPTEVKRPVQQAEQMEQTVQTVQMQQAEPSEVDMQEIQKAEEDSKQQ